MTRPGLTPPDPADPSDPDEAPETLSSVEEARRAEVDRDGVAALHDSEAETGDEEGVEDSFDLDQTEARELGVELDPVDGPEPELD